MSMHANLHLHKSARVAFESYDASSWVSIRPRSGDDSSCALHLPPGVPDEKKQAIAAAINDALDSVREPAAAPVSEAA